MLWVQGHDAGLAWPSLGLMASGEISDRRRPRSWDSYEETTKDHFSVYITHHTSQTSPQTRPQTTDQNHGSQTRTTGHKAREPLARSNGVNM